MKNILILIMLLFYVLQSKAETNQVYVTTVFGARGTLTNYNYNIPSPDQIKEAKKILESLPAKDFPQGNWGVESGGFQLSCRFEKSTFTNGEPILVIILVRNVGKEQLEYPFPSFWNKEGPVDFTVSTEQGKSIFKKSIIGSTTAMLILPGTQHKYYENLINKRNVLTNGTYLVNAYIEVQDPEGKWSRVESGKAKITIK